MCFLQNKYCCRPISFLNIAKAIFKLDRRIQNAYAGQKDCENEGFCIRLASHKRLSNVQID